MYAVFQLRKIARELCAYADKQSLLKEIRDVYDIDVHPDSDVEHVQALSDSLKRLPTALVRDCGIKSFAFEDLGPSKEYYPNHGVYRDSTLALNYRILEDPTLIEDPENGKSANKFEQTLYHELGHGWDEAQSDKAESLSLTPEWMSLSEWTLEPKPGFKRIKIQEKGTPIVVGEYYYSPAAGFTRFYAKRNPWDDWADSFSYYVAGLTKFLPKSKIEYFDEKLGKYYKGE